MAWRAVCAVRRATGNVTQYRIANIAAGGNYGRGGGVSCAAFAGSRPGRVRCGICSTVSRNLAPNCQCPVRILKAKGASRMANARQVSQFLGGLNNSSGIQIGLGVNFILGGEIRRKMALNKGYPSA